MWTPRILSTYVLRTGTHWLHEYLYRLTGGSLATLGWDWDGMGLLIVIIGQSFKKFQLIVDLIKHSDGHEESCQDESEKKGIQWNAVVRQSLQFLLLHLYTLSDKLFYPLRTIKHKAYASSFSDHPIPVLTNERQLWPVNSWGSLELN